MGCCGIHFDICCPIFEDYRGLSDPNDILSGFYRGFKKFHTGSGISDIELGTIQCGVKIYVMRQRCSKILDALLRLQHK